MSTFSGEDHISLSGGEVSFEEISQSEGLKRKLKENAFTLLTYLEGVLLRNTTGHKFIICLDRLDDNWLKDQIPEYSKILINLINICQFINTAAQYRDVLRIIIFLRTDIYETLSFNDKNKIGQDSAVEIFWDEESLNDMFFERIKRNKPAQIALDATLKTNSIFDVKYIRHGATPLKHVLRRTFLRPRDLIVFANKIRSVHVVGKSSLYSSKDIYLAEKDYSESMYDELIDEWINQMPKVKDYLAILQNIRFLNFTYTKFAEQAQRVLNNPTRAEMHDVLRFLFQNSIIGQKISANWEFLCANPHMRIDFGKPFHVNAGLKDRLMLTEGSAR